MSKKLKHTLRLGVNIDHVATVRNARGDLHPCPVRAAKLAKKAGADGITAHLREDRRHIRDTDIFALKKDVRLPLNMEMAATKEMLKIALKVKPHAACIVPERREEITTEGGLNVVKHAKQLRRMIAELKKAKIRVSLFINADPRQVKAAEEVGADIVEFHTGALCHAKDKATYKKELEKLKKACALTKTHQLECHAGHGITYDTVEDIAKIPEIVELNIGHFLMGEAMFVGMKKSIKRMRKLMDKARA
ncbi:MAG: pyridoxine 5'-phosphate synthase [Proteobacteria bacterium]|nr:pyridoxine 5'-phosphate synthase [Pseudomonadota bacterium]